MIITVVKYFYECGKCYRRQTGIELPGDPYGDFLLKSRNYEYRILFAVENNAYNEFRKLVKLRLADGVSDSKRSKLVQNGFKFVCDKDSKGDYFHMDKLTFCLSCGSSDMSRWGEIQPPEFSDLDIEPPSFTKWNSLDDASKLKIVDKAIEEDS